jgi:hypothetical protein
MNGEIVPFASAPRGERELVIAALPARLQELTAATELAPVDLDALDADALFQLGVKAFQSSTVRMAYAGHCWALAKERAGGGRSWIEARAVECGIGRQHIYNAIEVLAQLVRAPDGLVQPVGQLDYTKVLLLKKLDDNELEDLAERGETDSGITLDDIMNRPRRELDKLLTQATHAERYTRKKLDAAHKHIEQLGAELTALRARTDWQGDLPLSVTEARQDGVACGEFAQECLVRMESLYRTVLVRGDLSDEDTLREAQLRAGLIPLHTAVLGVAAAATALLRAMQDQVGEFLPAEYTAELALSREECAAGAEKRHYMVTHLDHLPSETRLRNEAVQARAQRLQAKKAGRQRRAGGA